VLGNLIPATKDGPAPYMKKHDFDARHRAVDSISTVVLGSGPDRLAPLLNAIFPNLEEVNQRGGPTNEVLDNIYASVLAVVNDLAHAIFRETGRQMPLYYRQYADRWRATLSDPSAFRKLISDPDLHNLLLADLRERARQPGNVEKINSIVRALNADRFRDANLIIDAYGIADWALRHARPAPKSLSIWVQILQCLHIRKFQSEGALIAAHPEYKLRKSKFSRNAPTDVAQIIEFANLLAKRLVADHPDVHALKAPGADKPYLWVRAFRRDLGSRSPRDGRSAFWEVHERAELAKLIRDLRDKRITLVLRQGMVRVVAGGGLVAGTEASMLEAMVTIHMRSYAAASIA
jgi:hypothetical protein